MTPRSASLHEMDAKHGRASQLAALKQGSPDQLERPLREPDGRRRTLGDEHCRGQDERARNPIFCMIREVLKSRGECPFSILSKSVSTDQTMTVASTVPEYSVVGCFASITEYSASLNDRPLLNLRRIFLRRCSRPTQEKATDAVLHVQRKCHQTVPKTRWKRF